MKRLILTFLGLSVLLGCTQQPGSSGDIATSEIESVFINPPESIQTSIYWYWISDHISEQGVIKDLESMKEKGINRAFIGNIGLSEPEAGRGNVRFYSEEWWKILHTALKTATRLGIDIGIFNSPGWSQSGGPWVQSHQAMRYLAYTLTPVEGGKEVSVILPRPESPFSGDFQDVKVIAYPVAEGSNKVLNLSNTAVKATPHISGLNALLDGNKESVAVIANHQQGGADVMIDFTSQDDFTLRSLRIYPAERPVNYSAVLQVKENDTYHDLAEFPVSRFNPQLNVGFDPYAPVVVSVPATTGRQFCLKLINVPPGCGLKEVELSSFPLVESYPEKTLAKMYQTPLPYWHEYQWGLQPALDDPALAVEPSGIIDISDRLQGEQLTWNAPEGNWMVMRTGMLPTGVTNAPASPEATGLETDKMSKEHIEAHFEAFLGEIYRRIPAEDRACWKVVVEDSYETGGQNFTDGFLEDFRKRYGYDPLPFLPVYAGIVVESPDASDRFLWDVRRMIADKISYDYVGGLREISHRYGLTTWLENYGHWGFPGEFLQYGGQSDEIGGEYWSEGELGDIENRAASSCGHIYGKNKISAESFTAGGGGYHRYPAMMKQRGDRFFTEGINNTLLHLYISQPYEDREPGVNAPFANEFNRKNTWYPHMDLFITYIKRVNFMLQQGLNVADVAYFIGGDAPKMTGVTDPTLPVGYQFDYMNAEVIERDMTVKDGLLTLPHGTQYRMMVLPRLETMRPELLQKIGQLIKEGGIILGPAPKRSPSYQNYPEADKEIERMAAELWGQIDPGKKYATIGKGMLMDGMDMEEALKQVKCLPDCGLSVGDPVLYGHRTMKGMDIYFVSNQSDRTINFEPRFRIKGYQPELWDPLTGAIRTLPSFTITAGGTTSVPLKLEAYESAFIVFRKKATGHTGSASLELNYPTPEKVEAVNTAWQVFFDTARRGPGVPLNMDKLTDLSTHTDFDIQHYSGTVVYKTSFQTELPEKGKKVYLNLNDVTAMAKIKVNGTYAGGVWTPPYKVEITGLLAEGRNELEVEVTTTWKNRLVGDLKLPEDQRHTWLTFQPWRATEPLQKSGLIGPVQLETYSYR